MHEKKFSVAIVGAGIGGMAAAATLSQIGIEIRGLEQNPETKSRWEQMAGSGKKVMQFLSEGRYVANVVDGKVTLYGAREGIPSVKSEVPVDMHR